jgi:AraC-like DNA-binding protein
MYREYAPHPALAPYVDRLWTSTAEAGAPPRRILPDGCIDIIVDTTTQRTAVVGTMTRAIVVAPTQPVRTVAVRFRPGGAVPLLRIAADELTDRSVDVRDLRVRVDALSTDELQRWLLDRLDERPDATVAYGASRLFSSRPPSIEALGRELGWSRQHLTRMFRRHVGVSAKQLARVARLQRAVDELQRGTPLGRVATGVGYFDQAHMTRDVRELADITPLAIRDAGDSIFPIRSLFAAP